MLATCHRIEIYGVLPELLSPLEYLSGLGAVDLPPPEIHTGPAALAHLFAVAAGLDSAVAGEPQILAQVRHAYRGSGASHPLLVAAFARALYAGRTIRAAYGLASARSVGSLAVDAIVSRLGDAERATVLVIGAGEMGKLAVRALGRRVARVVVANRDVGRATALAEAYDAEAIPLAGVPDALARADGVVSAADTRGAVLSADLLAARLRLPRSLVVVDVAMPRGIDGAGRALLGDRYTSVDDLPGASARVPGETLRAARERCEAEAARFWSERAPQHIDAIRTLRASAERVRAEKLSRALHRLSHLSERDRRVVEALATTITNALLHEPTVALREQRADPRAARALFERSEP